MKRHKFTKYNQNVTFPEGFVFSERDYFAVLLLRNRSGK